MKLLFDQNCSRRLVHHLAEAFPGSTHVSLLDRDREDDGVIWEYARRESLVIVTKDTDFLALAELCGHPPWLVWLRLGNCPTGVVAEALMTYRKQIEDIVVQDRHPSLRSVHEDALTEHASCLGLVKAAAPGIGVAIMSLKG